MRSIPRCGCARTSRSACCAIVWRVRRSKSASGRLRRCWRITDLLERFPPSISGGAQQRVSLARALIRNAAVYLLDEPMSQLEPQLRALLRARIKDYLIAHKMTTVIVTHDQTEAIALADRIAVMEKGVLQQFATPQRAAGKHRPTCSSHRSSASLR